MLNNKIILIHYNGPSRELFSLMPDNGLATLASFLLLHKYEPLIIDFITTEMTEKIFSAKMKNVIKKLHKLNDELRIIRPTKEMEELKGVFHNIIKENEYKLSQHIIKYIKTFNSKIVGFKLWEGAGFHGSIRIAGEIKKELPHVITVAGGPHVDMYDRYILDYTPAFDFLIYGEGETGFIELIKYINGKGRLTSVPNLIYREGHGIKKNPPEFIKNIEEIPPPVYDEEIYPSMKGDKKIKIFLIEESRGCPNRCNFCIHPGKSGSLRRSKSPQRIVDEIEKTCSGGIRFSGSNPPPGLLTSISKELMKRNLSVNYSTFGHVNNFSSEDYRLMRQAGCISMAFGIESGSQYILDNAIGKGMSSEQSKSALKASKSAGIYTIASIIVPSPYETKETLKETMDLLLDTVPDSVTVQFPMLTPHTAWWDTPEKYCFHFKDKDELARKLMLRSPPTILPLALWERIHYKLNGMYDRDLFNITGKFTAELKHHGIEGTVSDFFAILAISTGIGIKKLKEKSEKSLMTGDIEVLQDIVRTINKSIKRKEE